MSKIAILIVEDESMIALGLALAAEDAGAVVVGPVATVSDALLLLEAGGIDAAVIDANVLDGHIAPVAVMLIEQALPFVVHTATGLAGDLPAAFGDAPFVMKPARPEQVLCTLMHAVNERH